MVSFNQTPNRRIPFASVELDNSQALGESATQLKYTALLIGQKLAAGNAVAGRVYRVTNEEQVKALAGANSMLHHGAQAWFSVNKTTPLWIGVVADDGAGAAATATVTLAGTATANGTIALYIGGRRVLIPVTVGDTAADLAADLNAAVPSAGLIVTAGVAAAIVTLTARHKGLTGNDIDLRHSYEESTESLPAGITVTLSAFTGGTTAPSLATLFANNEEKHFHVIAHPYTDAATMTAVENELTRRWGPTVQLHGQAVTAKRGDFSTVATYGETRNTAMQTCFPSDDSPTPPWEDAAASAGVLAFYGEIDPAKPFVTLRVPWLKAGREDLRFNKDERDLLLYSGIATRRVGADGVVQFERVITMYRENDAGGDDISYLDLNTRLSLMYAINDLITVIPARYPRAKLGDDGVRYPAGEDIVTPSTIVGEGLAWFDRMSTQSPVVFDPATRDAFKEAILAERNGPTRVDLFVPPDLINQFLQLGTKLSFRL